MAKTKSDAGLPRIFTVRKMRVVLDFDLARLYGVPTTHLNQAVKRNARKFPPQFSFLLTPQEFGGLISQSVTSNRPSETPSNLPAISKGRRGGTRKATRAFSEHGALMAATILRSERAVQMSIYLVSAFVEMREALLANATILKRLAEIDRRLIEHDSVLREMVERLQPLLDAPDVDEEPKSKIGFHQGNR